jgi:hypothetical protein
MEYYMGLDLGQAQDHTAIAVVTLDDLYKEVVAFNAEVRRRRYPSLKVLEPPEVTYETVYLERLRLGTRYPEVVERVRTLLDTPPLKDNAELSVDGTGVGRAVVDMLRGANLSFKSVVITSGEREVQEGDVYKVPKRDLCTYAQVLLQTRRLKIAPALPEAKTLTEELLDFRYEITRSGNDTYGVWREGDHDDLVLALCLAVWAAVKRSPPVNETLRTGSSASFGPFQEPPPFPPQKDPIF